MDDFTVNVRQIGNYPQLDFIGAYDLVLVQQGGLGGPYACVTQDGLLGQVYERVNVGILPAPFNKGIASSYLITPLGQRQGFNWYVDEDGVQRYLQNGPAGYWSVLNNGDLIWATIVQGEKDDVIDTTAWQQSMVLTPDGELFIGNSEAATQLWVQTNAVLSFNSRMGAVTLTLADITAAGGAPILSPDFTGTPTAPTQNSADNSAALATTAYVQTVVNARLANMVSSFNGRTGVVTLTAGDITNVGGALLNSPAFSGVPTAPTASPADNSTTIATTAFVAGNFLSTSVATANYAPLANPVFTGVPMAPTAAPGTHTGQLATTAFVAAAVTAATTGVASFNTRTGAVVLTTADVTGAGGAVLASPAFTGTPTAPTAAPGTTTTQLATTAFVSAAVTAATAGVASFNTRTGAVTLQLADVTAVGGAPVASPAFSGTPTGPTAAIGTSTTQLATTAFVLANSVASFNGRTGVVSLNTADISAAGGAVLASPAFTGTPTAPTATAGTNTTQLATTAFVTAALSVAGGVSSFNGRAGAVTMVTTDITNAGGAPINSPTFTGTPSSVTAAPGNNSTAIATTAFVTAAIAAAVVSFNGRTGAVTLTAADITGAGGAVLASPAFTGTPTAPTALPGTNTTQLATTAFVQSYVPLAIQSNIVNAVIITLASTSTLSSGWNGCIIVSTASTAITITCPNNVTTNFYCTVIQVGAGAITFVAGSGATLTNRQGLLHSAGAAAMCALVVTSNTSGTNAAFVLGGDCA